jgi:hypothetical protein
VREQEGEIDLAGARLVAARGVGDLDVGDLVEVAASVLASSPSMRCM